MVSLLEALDVRIAAGLAILRRDAASARDHLDEARGLISSTLRREALSAWAATRDRSAQAQAQAQTQTQTQTQTPAQTQARAPHNGGLTPRKARQLADYIDVRLAGRLSLPELARAAGLSRSYFCRAFRVTFGVTPHQYVEARRIEAAQRLMLEEDSPLVQIALACGFADATRFSKAFRRMVGVAPSRWRRERRL